MYATLDEYQALERVIDQLKKEFEKKDAEIAEKQATIEALRKTNKDLLNDLDYYSLDKNYKALTNFKTK